MKKNFKLIFGLASTLLLAGCGAKPGVSTLPPMDEALASSIDEQLEIVGADAIYGNIYLQEEIEGATIKWESSDVNIINPNWDGDMAPGVVSRPNEDTTVTLTATAEKDGTAAKFTREVTVKGLDYEIQDEEYVGYLMGHFISDSGANGEQIYFALADEGQGLNFKDMNKKQPVLKSTVGEKGVRDPYICRSPEGDRFFLVATDLSINNRGGWKKNAQGYYDPSCTGSHDLILWQSNDLVNWGDPYVIKDVAPENAGMAWAPEMIYDDNAGEYLIFFASSIMNTETKYKAKPNAIYYTATRDFVHYSETKLFIDNYDEPDGKAREIIDTTVIKIDDTYYSASKDGDNDENNGGIRIMKTTDLRDPTSWEKVMNLADTGLKASNRALDNKLLEGPEFFRYNRDDRRDADIDEYGLWADQYAISGGYLPLSTTDIEDTTSSSWKVLAQSEYSFDSLKKRHGTILRLTSEEIARIKEAYPAA
ncbi:MAG: glycoside hydrolase family 43 protein [Bacilli bacterium]|nr:glycoside hydrolase family 43 protein [Bacilli bacterium]